MEARVYVCDSAKTQDLKKIVEADPYQKDSFATQGYILKGGDALGMDAKKMYLYIKAEADFFKIAEEKLKGIVERAKKEDEEKIVKSIEDEQNSAASGFGSMFG